MTDHRRRRTSIWWLSGSLAILGALIAIFAAQELFLVTLVCVAVAVVVTVLLGVALSRADSAR